MAYENTLRFVIANNASPVVFGALTQPDPRQPPRGARYRLQDGKSFKLTADECRALPEGYPKWLL